VKSAKGGEKADTSLADRRGERSVGQHNGDGKPAPDHKRYVGKEKEGHLAGEEAKRVPMLRRR